MYWLFLFYKVFNHLPEGVPMKSLSFENLSYSVEDPFHEQSSIAENVVSGDNVAQMNPLDLLIEAEENDIEFDVIQEYFLD